MKIEELKGIEMFLEKIKEKEIKDFQLAYKLAKISKKVNDELVFFEKEYKKIIDGKLEKTENGFIVKPEFIDEVNESLEKLSTVDYEVDIELTEKELQELGPMTVGEVELIVNYIK